MRLTVRIDDVRDLGERVLALGRLEGIGHTTGLPVGGELATSEAMPRASKPPG